MYLLASLLRMTSQPTKNVSTKNFFWLTQKRKQINIADAASKSGESFTERPSGIDL